MGTVLCHGIRSDCTGFHGSATARAILPKNSLLYPDPITAYFSMQLPPLLFSSPSFGSLYHRGFPLSSPLCPAGARLRQPGLTKQDPCDTLYAGQHKLFPGLHKQAVLIKGSRSIRYPEGAESRPKMASGAFFCFSARRVAANHTQEWMETCVNQK